MGRLKEVVDKIGKITSLKFKYVALLGMEDVEEVEATPNEINKEVNKDRTQTATKQLPTFACMRTIHVARIRKDNGQELVVMIKAKMNRCHQARGIHSKDILCPLPKDYQHIGSFQYKIHQSQL